MLRLAMVYFLLMGSVVQAQRSDYIVLKKKNNERTVKTYFPGTFIKGATYGGFQINGYVKNIRNDSLFIEQQEVYQVPTQFGVPKLDTVVYTIPIRYIDIKSFDFSTRPGRRKGFSQARLPLIMMMAGTGYVILETVNTIYRNESFSDQNKLAGMGIAAGVALTGFMWQRLHNDSRKAGTGYRVIYVNMH